MHFGRWSVAASILLLVAAGLVGVLLVSPFWTRNDRDRVGRPVPHKFNPEAKSSGFAGPEASENRLVTVSVPALPVEVFGPARGGRLTIIECVPGKPPRVWPTDDPACPWVLPGRSTPPTWEPFARPVRGQKWVILLVTDRPAASAVKKLIAAGHDFEQRNGSAASEEAAVAQVKALGYQVFAHGTHSLEPVTR
jgi:hypothetical protein